GTRLRRHPEPPRRAIGPSVATRNGAAALVGPRAGPDRRCHPVCSNQPDDWPSRCPGRVRSAPPTVLVEPGEVGGAFTLLPVIQEYMIERLVDTVDRELHTGEHDALHRYPLINGLAPDWVRRSQEDQLARPILRRLIRTFGTVDAVEAQLRECAAALR